MNFNETYTHTQSVPATEWMVTHDLNKEVVSDVFFDVNSNGILEKVIPLSVEKIDLNNLKVTFSTNQIGKVKVA